MESFDKLEQNNIQIAKLKDEINNLENTLLNTTKEGENKRLKDEFLKTYPFFRATNGASGYADTNVRTGFLGLSGVLLDGKAPTYAVYRTIIPRIFSLNGTDRTTTIRGSGNGAANHALYAWCKASTEWSAFITQYKDKNIAYLIESQESYLNENPSYREYTYKEEWDKYRMLDSINATDNKFVHLLDTIRVQKQQVLQALLEENVNLISDVVEKQENTQKELEALQQQNIQKEQELQELQRQNEQNLEEIENIKKQIQIEQNRQKELEALLEENKLDLQEKEALKLELEALKTEIERLKGEFVEVDLESLRIEKDELERQLELLREQIANNEENTLKAEKLQREIEELKRQIEELKKDTTIQELLELQAKKEELEREKAGLQESLQEAGELIKSLRGEIVELELEIVELQNNENLEELESLQIKKEELKAQKEALLKETQELEEQLKLKSQENESLEIEIAQLLKRRTELLAEMKENIESHNLEKLIECLKKEIFLLEGREELWTPFYELKLIHQLLARIDLRENSKETLI
ncbi:hypothetical protein [Helicobacter sp. WB40]|uniref:hypothetical protein n=1 Tax=Helicobacter sp. WB40 TaxID=3004130 RepID=UPI0022EBBACE|nr:hypothetical protein [Helicobacter sp. WB40]MDA3967373.1 hypothetical protein [Helicobacter sp. WB40]